MSWLNFEDEKFEKGFAPFELSSENIKKNQGKRIVYLRRKDVDANRGYAFPKYGKIHKKHYSQLLLDDGHNSVDIRDIIECGIEINKPQTT